MSGRQKTALVSQRERSHATLAPDDQPKQSPYTVIPWQYYALLNNEELSDEDMSLATRVFKGINGYDYVSKTGATMTEQAETAETTKAKVVKRKVKTNDANNPVFQIAKLAVENLNNTEKGALFGILCRELGYELE